MFVISPQVFLIGCCATAPLRHCNETAFFASFRSLDVCNRKPMSYSRRPPCAQLMRASIRVSLHFHSLLVKKGAMS
jgi:hypothetical protein